MPADNELDLDKLFLPAWAQEPASANLYAEYQGEEAGPDRRGPRRGGRPEDRGRRRERRPGFESRAGGRREEGRHGERRPERRGAPEERGQRRGPPGRGG